MDAPISTNLFENPSLYLTSGYNSIFSFVSFHGETDGNVAKFRLGIFACRLQIEFVFSLKTLSIRI